jgi:peptidyl-tRNA hydrolase, PTH1 family
MADLRLVAGLGNPGPQYADTRHNVGFMVIDALATKERIDLAPSTRWGCELGKWGNILLAKPLTYMNRSGQAVGALSRYYKIAPEELLVVVDDVALPLGRLRLRAGGSDGGHNGLRSVIDHLGEMFQRLRIGIGASQGGEEMVDHVLGRFAPDEEKIVREAIERSVEAIAHVAEHGITSAMNTYNRAEIS